MVQTGGTLNAVPKTLPKQLMLQLHLWFLLRTSLLLDPNSRETVKMPRMLPQLRLGKNMSEMKMIRKVNHATTQKEAIGKLS